MKLRGTTYCNAAIWALAALLAWFSESGGLPVRPVLTFYRTAGEQEVSAEADRRIDIVLEAESFSGIEGTRWEIRSYGETYFCGPRSNYMSRKKCLHLDADQRADPLHARVHIPVDGIYRIWARYEHPPNYNTAFKVILTLDGLKVFDEQYGKRRHEKLWPFERDMSRVPRWPASGADNFIWEGDRKDVFLKTGRYAVEIHGLDNPSPGADRNVDVLLLTNDLTIPVREKLPFLDRLTRENELFLRLQRPVTVTGNSYYILEGRIPRHPFHRPRAYISADGLSGEEPLHVSWLRPGETTPWIDISGYLDCTNETILMISEAGVHDLFQVNVEVSTDPEGKIRQRIAYREDGNPLLLVIPVDLSGGGRVQTAEEIARELWKYVSSFPERGQAPERIRCYGVSIPEESSTDLYGTHFKIYEKLGFNTFTGSARKIKDLSNYGLQPSRDVILRCAGLSDGNIDKQLAILRNSGKSELVNAILLDGQAVFRQLHQVAFSRRNNRLFRDYIREQGLLDLFLADLGGGNGVVKDAQSLDEIVDEPGEAVKVDDGMTEDDRFLNGISLSSGEVAPSNPLLYYHSRKFQPHIVKKDLLDWSGEFESSLNSAVLLGIVPSPDENLKLDAGRWITPARLGVSSLCAGSVTMKHLQQDGAVSAAFWIDVLRCASKYGNAPILFGVPAFTPGISDANFRRMTYLAIGHGATLIDFMNAGPQYMFRERFIRNDDRERYRTLYEMIHEIGAAEACLYGGRRRPSGVAMLISESTEIWETPPWVGSRRDPGSNLFDQEMKCLYYAIRNAGYPVDLLTEQDIESGGHLSRYPLLVMTGDHVTRAAADSISAWVRKGGVLFGTAGAGMRDEVDRELDSLREAFGVSTSRLERTDSYFTIKNGLPQLRPIDRIAYLPVEWESELGLYGMESERLNELKRAAELGNEVGESVSSTSLGFDAIALKQVVEPAETARVLGTFVDGSPAVLMNRWGEGRTILLCSLPGTQSLRYGVPARPLDQGAGEGSFLNFSPSMLDPSVSVMLEYVFRLGRIQRDILQGPLPIYTAVIESDEGMVVTLVNFSIDPELSLPLKITGVPKPRNVFSVRRGELRFVHSKNVLELAISLEIADMIVIKYQPG